MTESNEFEQCEKNVFVLYNVCNVFGCLFFGFTYSLFFLVINTSVKDRGTKDTDWDSWKYEYVFISTWNGYTLNYCYKYSEKHVVFSIQLVAFMLCIHIKLMVTTVSRSHSPFFNFFLISNISLLYINLWLCIQLHLRSKEKTVLVKNSICPKYFHVSIRILTEFLLLWTFIAFEYILWKTFFFCSFLDTFVYSV